MSTTDNIDDCTDFENVNKNNFRHIQNKALKIGYADGLSDGRKRDFQNGFDQGYKDGLTISFDLEKFKFFFHHLKTDNINGHLAAEKEVYKTLSILNLKSLQHSSDLILQKNVDETIVKFAQGMPVATSLLNVQASKNFL